MKIIIIFVLFIYNLMAISAQDAAWLLNAQTDLDKAYEVAKIQKKKMLFLLIVKDGCNWCSMMVENTLRDKNIQANLEDMVTVVVDSNNTLPKIFKTKLTPAMFFIDVESKNSVLKQTGYIKKGAFLIDIISASEMVE